jgi:pilus assembly protein Flp/PilA
MRQFAHSVVKFAKAEDGPTAVEYAVMLALIIVVVIGAVTTVGTKSSGTFNTTGNSLPSGS